MTIWQFMGENPWLSFFLALIAGQVLIGVLVNLPNRILRHRNIRMYGYPPPHCDSDGDFRKEEE